MPSSADSSTASPAIPGAGAPAIVTVYWRPSCPYCSRLRRALRNVGLETSEVNIWEDSGAAKKVRAIAGGNETVPTVAVGDIALVNPSVKEILGALQIVAPDRIEGRVVAAESSRRRVRTIQWLAISVLVGASFLVESIGNARLSWLIDGFAAALYIGFRFIRIRRFRPSR